MKKQELIDYCESLKGDLNKFINGIDVNKIIKKIEQLDEPQKPVVPQFVANWYEDIKVEFYVVLERLVLNYKNNTDMPICKWFFETEDALTILINMHQFGYEVEKEKRYLVKMKGITISTRYLKHNTQSANWFLSGYKEAFPYRTKHTRKELEEAGFGWVFDCEGMEVEEVQDETTKQISIH